LFPNGHVKHLKLKHLPSYGLGKIAFSPSNDMIHCGGADLYWRYPTATVLSPNDQESKLSPTEWSDFKQINFSDPSLEWFRYEEERKIRLKKLIVRPLAIDR
jgi:hypothetical protein